MMHSDALPEAIRGRSVDAREGWLRLPSGFIIQLLLAKSLSGDVPKEQRWKWSRQTFAVPERFARRPLLQDPSGQLWDWKVGDGFWLKRKENA